VRIISGHLKARRFSVPKGFPSRPTTDFAKEGLFNVLENQFVISDSKILDLCVGTGNISFEFISRNASAVTGVDLNFRCLNHVRKMASELQITNQLQTVKSDILHFLTKTEHTYDLIFADPPYDYSSHAEIAKLVFERNLLNEDGILIIEHGRNTVLDAMIHYDFTRVYGNVYFSFFSSKLPPDEK
jgi:16S rRNA (guanine966-N2)-methyltransferase